jgi:hypothetical protein
LVFPQVLLGFQQVFSAGFLNFPQVQLGLSWFFPGFPWFPAGFTWFSTGLTWFSTGFLVFRLFS